MACDECPSNTPEAEALPSQVANFVKAFFGVVGKTAGDNDTVDWILPCDMDSDEPILGYPKEIDITTGALEGIGCYILRVLREGVTGLNGANAYGTTTLDYTQPAVLGSVTVTLDTVAPFAVDQPVWISGNAGYSGGFYIVTAISGLSLTLTNSYGPPNNLEAGNVVPAGAKVLPSGAAETSGPQGVQGIQGEVGPKGDTGSVWRNGAGVPANSLGVAGDYYLNDTNGDVYFKETTTYSVIANVKGPVGPQGPAGATPGRTWIFSAPGEHTWVCPDGITEVRVNLWGAGGGGGGGASTGNGGGNGYGGGGGEHAEKVITVVEGASYALLVGLGGAGGTGGDNTANGAAGTSSSFGGSVVANPGSGGGNAVDGAEGAGSTPGSGTADTRNPGYPAALDLGGKAGTYGVGGIENGAGESPGGGGAGGLGDGGVGGKTGGAGANGKITLEFIE